MYLGKNPISWSSREQKTRARSSTEAEYRAIAATTAELLWLRNLFQELGISLPLIPVIYTDNASASYINANPRFHSKTKHLALDYHFVRANVQAQQLRVSPISTTDQLVDALTKPLPCSTFLNLISKIDLTKFMTILREHVKDNIISY